jgi:hypothetical protein
MAKQKRKLRHKTEPPPLTARQIRFCQLWIEKGNAYQCYLEAGCPLGINRNATDQIVKRLVRKRQIREYCRHLQQVAATAAEMTIEEIAAGIAAIARADRRGVMTPAGKALPPGKWPADVVATIESFEFAEGGTPTKKTMYLKKIKTASRMAAFTKLAEWRGMTKPEGGPTAQDIAGELLRGAVRREIEDGGTKSGTGSQTSENPGPVGSGGSPPDVEDTGPSGPD